MAWMASFLALPFMATYRVEGEFRLLPGLGPLFFTRAPRIQPPRNDSSKAQPLLPGLH